MFSIQWLFAEGDSFQELLEAAAREAHETVLLAVALIKSPQNTQNHDDLILARQKEKCTSRKIGEELVEAFSTGLEREDIEALNRALFRIPKAAEKLANYMLIVRPQLRGPAVPRYADTMSQASGAVVDLICQLRDIRNVTRVAVLCQLLEAVENEAERHMREIRGDLYTRGHEAIRAMAIRDVCELMEKVVERCQLAGSLAMKIVLKNS
ncbi:MAG: hypothetical protein ABSH48_05875 [Verrucomicrobiota bacterium]|jgi:uncharacterized protein Yka (UPF0111/DUF47 family)